MACMIGMKQLTIRKDKHLDIMSYFVSWISLCGGRYLNRLAEYHIEP